MSRQITSAYAPKPRLTLHVGITGHRPERLADKDMTVLRERIAAVLQEIDSLYRQIALSDEAQNVFLHGEPLPPRLLSPLAEGADRIAAEAALQHGYALHCPLPFPRAIYADDFKHNPSSQAAFEHLLTQAERILELDGTRNRQDAAYRNVGHFILRHADILLAVWNGEKNAASPGTAGIVAEALRQGVPVVWIKASATHSVQLHDPYDSRGAWQTLDTAKLTALLRQRLLPPDILVSENDAPEEPSHGRAPKQTGRFKNKPPCQSVYFTHPEPKRNLLGTVYRTLFAWFGKRSVSSMFGNAYRQDAEYQWRTIADNADASWRIATETQAHFICADSLASYYADQYRGTFVASFTLGGFAVLWALLGAPFGGTNHAGTVFAWLEFGTVAIVAGLIYRGNKRHLHQRWLDFRLLAERLRQHAFLAPCGGISDWSLPAFHTHGDRSHAWVGWLVRSLCRAEGIPQTSFSAEFRNAYRTYLLTMIEDQAHYHRLNAERNEHIAHTLHGINWTLLIAIVAACLLHIFSHAPGIAAVSTIVAAVLPAFGAAAAGILSQGEFERIARRSAGMEKHLEQISASLKQSGNISAGELAQQAQQAIDVMSQELSDWRVIFRAKPLEIHA